MTNTKTLFIFLPLLMLACSLTAQVTPRPQDERSAVLLAPKQIMLTQAPTNTNRPPVCQVKTGLLEGRLNVRSCGGLACPVLAVIREGETLTPTQTEPVNGWLEIQTAGGLRGWVNSNYCEEKK
jgi:uncharacterized protein YgiM (DUF1202 family)